MENDFTREDTKVIKGIAILLMLMHHLWGFPERIMGGELKYYFNIFDQSSISYIGMFGKICVSIFFFLGGYGIYLSSRGKKFDIIGKIKKLYISFWKIFVIMIPIAFLFFGRQPVYCENQDICTKYSAFEWKEFLGNITGIQTTYNGEWWFLFSYVVAIATFPVIRYFIDKNSFNVNIILVIIASLFVTNICPALGNIEVLGTLNNNYLYRLVLCQSAPYVTCFWMGIIVAKDKILNRLQEELKKNNLLNPVIDSIIWFLIIYFRQSGLGNTLDIIYVPFLIVTAVDFMYHIPILRTIFLHIGKYSTNMWLLHTFFCYYFYPMVKIVVAPGWAIPSLIILGILTYGASIVIHYFWNLIEQLYHIIIKKPQTNA